MNVKQINQDLKNKNDDYLEKVQIQEKKREALLKERSYMI